MKQFKVLVALVLVAMMSLALVGSALAEDPAPVTITINRDSSYTGADASSTPRTYTWYRVFTVTPADVGSTNTSTTPGTITTTGSNAAYTAQGGTNSVASKLGEWVAASGTPGETGYTAAHWQKASGNEWFDLTPIAGTNNYSVAWVGNETAARAQAAAAWLITNGVYEATDTMTANNDGSQWTASVPAGYYLIKGSSGANLVAATTNITIYEKNTYPGLDKKQKQEADSSYTEAQLPAEIGSYIDYQVTVTVPNDANKAIAVIDTMTTGLVYDATTGLTVKEGENTVDYAVMTSSDAEYSNASNVAWQIKFSDDTVVANQGKSIVITYRAQVTADALTVDVRNNTATLKYDQGKYILTDTVDNTTYFAGIEKVDGTTTTIKLSGVKFALTVGGTAFNVQKVTPANDGQPYYIPGGSSNIVETGTNGLIIIRGLRNDKTYVLTETENPNAGYNLLAAPVELSVTREDVSTTPYATQTYDQVLNNKGTVLPSTGGVGTTIFYIAGAVLVLGAAAVILARRKAEQE